MYGGEEEATVPEMLATPWVADIKDSPAVTLMISRCPTAPPLPPTESEVLGAEEVYVMLLAHGKEDIHSLARSPLALTYDTLNVPVKFPVISNLMSRLFGTDGSSSLQESVHTKIVNTKSVLGVLMKFIIYFIILF